VFTGYYMYLETSGSNPRGAKARLQSPKHNSELLYAHNMCIIL